MIHDFSAAMHDLLLHPRAHHFTKRMPFFDYVQGGAPVELYLAN